MLLVCLVPVCVAAAPWLVISDLHVNPYDSGRVPSGYGFDTNWALWSSAVAAMRAEQPNPAVIVVAGDFLAHHFPALVLAHHGKPAAVAVATMRRIELSLKRAFPHARIVVALGNNDDPCGDYRMHASGPYLNALARVWHRPLGNAGSYVAALPNDDRAIVLDDVYWSLFYDPCPGTRSNAPERELAWLRSALAATRAPQRVVLVEHVPPGIDAMSTLDAHRFLLVDYMRQADESAYLNELRAHAPQIAFAIAGHAHRSDFRVLGGVPTIVAPSISPIYANNPAFLTLAVGAGGALRDYTLVAYDARTARWAPEFDFDRVYGARRVDVATMLAAHAAIERDATVRQRWAASLVAGSPVAEVDAGDWRAAWCAQTTAGAQFEQCAHLRRRLLVIPIVGALLAIIILASVALIVLRAGSFRLR